MEGIDFIEDLAVVMLAAGLFGTLCKRIGLSVVVGYLAAGVLIGPYTPPFAFVHDLNRIHTLSQLGLIFLMFSIGLELSLNKMRSLGPSMAIATALGAFIVFNLTQALGLAAGWPKAQTTFTAAMLMVSSSAVIAKMLRDLGLEHERAGQQALGITVLEDIVAIVMLTLLGSYTKMGGDGKSTGISMVLAGLSGFVVTILMAALLFVPRLLRKLQQSKADPELQTIIVAGVLFALALAAVWAGYSLALGAFLLGAVVAELPQRHKVEHAFSGVRDIFSSVFFVSIGMLIDVHQIGKVWPWILGLGAFALVVRPLAVGLALVITGTPPQDARRAGLCLAPVGEFSFVIAQLGVEAGVLPSTHYTLAVGISLVTVILSPIINRKAGPLLSWVEKNEPQGVRRILNSYHQWLAEISAAPDSSHSWRRARSHVIHILVELLLVTGLLLSAEIAYDAVEKSSLSGTLDRPSLRILFWCVMGLVTLVPLVGIRWSVKILAEIAADVLQSENQLSSRIIVTGLRAGAAILVILWLWFIIPFNLMSAKAWWITLGFLTLALALFSQRLVMVRKYVLGSVEQVLEGTPDEPAAPQWEHPSPDWALNLQEVELPVAAACAGKTIAALGIRAQHGCTVVEINRQGFLLSAPEPHTILFPGDRLLLLGKTEQIAAARAELIRVSAGGGNETLFDDSLLSTMTVPDNSQVIGKTLHALGIPKRTGTIVVGISQSGIKRVNPTGDEIVGGGDQWLVVGSRQELRSLKRLLREGTGLPDGEVTIMLRKSDVKPEH